MKHKLGRIVRLCEMALYRLLYLEKHINYSQKIKVLFVIEELAHGGRLSILNLDTRIKLTINNSFTS